MVVVSADNHDLTSSRRIRALHDSTNILSRKRLAKNIDGNRGLCISLRILEVGQELLAGIRGNKDDRNFGIIRAVYGSHWSEPRRQVVPEVLRKDRYAPLAPVHLIRNNN